MTIENHQTRFNHEEWLNHLSRFMETGREFCNELLRALKIILQKGMSVAWKDIRTALSKLTPKDFFVTGLITCAGALGALVFMTGLGIFAYQAFLWLQNGVWTEFPLFAVFNFLFENTSLHQWIIQPESWLGLQKLITWFLESTPLSLALMIPGFSVALLMAGTLVLAILFRFNQLKNRND